MSDKKGIKKVMEMIDENRTCMLVTVDEHDELRSRPMGTAGTKGNDIYFFTDRYSGKLNEIREDSSVNLAYSYPNSNDYLSVSGTAQVIDNQKLIDEMWSPFMKAWFPKGKESERLRLLKVSPMRAEYWDASSSKIVEMFKIGKAVLTGEKYHSADHEKIAV